MTMLMTIMKISREGKYILRLINCFTKILLENWNSKAHPGRLGKLLGC